MTGNMRFLPPGFPRPVVPSPAVTGERVCGGEGGRASSSHFCPSAAIDPANHHLCEKKCWAPARAAGSTLPPLPRVASSLCRRPPPQCSSPRLPGKGAGKERSEWNWGSLQCQRLLSNDGLLPDPALRAGNSLPAHLSPTMKAFSPLVPLQK